MTPEVCQTPKPSTPVLKTIVLMLGLAVASAVWLGDHQASAAETAKSWVKRVQAAYQHVDDYTSDFIQTYKHPLHDKLRRSYGKVYFHKGGLMRWEYERPEPKLFVFDGATLWVFEPKIPQVVVSQGQTDKFRRALAFLTGEGALDKDYRATLLDADSLGFDQGIVLGLTPRDARSPYALIELYINANTALVERSVVVDKDGGRNRIDFSGSTVNAGVSPALFRFSPPSGVPVVQAEDAIKP